MSYDDALPKKKGKRSRRNSISGPPPVAGLSPDEYIGKEETNRITWKDGKKKKVGLA